MDWVEESITDLEEANVVGNTTRVFKIVKKLSNKPKPPPVNLTHDKDGSLLKSPQEVAAT